MTTGTLFSAGQAPGAWPLLGHVLPLMRRPLEFLTSLRMHGDLVEIRVGPKKIYVPTRPELIWEVLRNPGIFDKGGFFFDKVRHFLGNGLGTSAWSEHQNQRPLMQPAFSRNRLEGYTTVIHDEIRALTSSWQPGQTVELKAAMYALFARITSRTLFSSDLGAEAVTQVQESLPVIMNGLFLRMMDPSGLGERLPTPANRRFAAARTRMDAVIDEVIRRYRDSDTDHGDVLSRLLVSQDGLTGARFDDQELRDQIVTVLTGGSETTSTVLSWVLHLLSEHPEIEARMHAEIDQLTDGRLPDFAAASRLDYLRRVITEVLRMYPVAWILTRVTTADVTLGGHSLKAGSIIVVSPYLVHHNPDLFAEPERFDPDRWLPDRVTPRHRQAFLPFGGGARKCIGDVFSMTEAVMALAGIGAKWRLRPTPDSDPRILARTTLVPRSLSMVTDPRP